MRKPAEQWFTRTAFAVRIERPDDPVFASDTRAERFELRAENETVGYATFGLELQLVDGRVGADPDIALAARAWLAARGQRRINLHVADASGARVQALDVGSFTVRDLASHQSDVIPRRLVTLCPSNIEMVHALGCFDRVIACDVSSDFPPGIERVERLGQDLAPDLDRIATLAPDLVVSSLTVPGMERVVTGLAARGIPQLVLAPKSFDDVLQDARDLAHALGVMDYGEALVQSLERERAELREALAGQEPARVYLEWWPKPMFTPGRDCYSNELIELAGGVNVFHERAGASVEISTENLVDAQPDVCFVSWCGVAPEKLDPANLTRRIGLETLPAAHDGRVFPLDEAFSGRPGPRMLEASRIMARAIAATRSRA